MVDLVIVWCECNLTKMECGFQSEATTQRSVKQAGKTGQYVAGNHLRLGQALGLKQDMATSLRSYSGAFR